MQAGGTVTAYQERKRSMAEKKMVEAITSMEEDFAQWYTDIVSGASYGSFHQPLPLCNILPPY